MRNNRSVGKAIAGAVCALMATAGAVVWAAVPPAITATSIAHAKLAQGKTGYTRVLGGHFRFETAGGGSSPTGFEQPGNYTRLVFPKRKMYVYFKDGVDRAIQITTWNKAYRTAEGVGPCSTVAELKKAYGSRLKPSKWNTQNGETYVYTMGDLLFAAPDLTHVTAVGLYDSKAPRANKSGGALAFAGFVIQAPDQLPCV
jgi:hypothetical protein